MFAQGMKPPIAWQTVAAAAAFALGWLIMAIDVDTLSNACGSHLTVGWAGIALILGGFAGGVVAVRRDRRAHRRLGGSAIGLSLLVTAICIPAIVIEMIARSICNWSY